MAVTSMMLRPAHPSRHGVLAAAVLALGGSAADAAVIADTDPYAWSENAGWLNFKATAGNVQVHNDHLEGFVWHENLGWMRLGTYGGGSHTYTNTSATDYGVNRDSATGALSGYAWSENAGWINFGATNGNAAVDLTSGVFSGYVWGENIGWISLSGTAQNNDPYGVVLTTEAAECGVADGVASLLPPTTDLCTFGTAGPVTTANGTHHWTCAGVAGGTEAECSAPGSSSGGGGGGGGGGGSVTFVTTAGGCSVESASIVAPPAGGPVGLTMPYDAITFRLRSCTGSSATVQLTFSGPVGGQEYWKYINSAWVQMTSGVTLAGNTATIVIADNGPYDANPKLHEIDDPSGPAQRTVPIPTLSTWGLLLTAGVLGFLGTWRRRRAGVARRA